MLRVGREELRRLGRDLHDGAQRRLVSVALKMRLARDRNATVNVARRNGKLIVEVADDGVGGADPDNGTGLRGPADRLAVIEGRLELVSPPGEGTTVRAGIPCA
jgi:signal transduction histidine kinase